MGLSFFRSQQKGKPWVVCFFLFLPFGARCHMQPPCMQMGDILRRGLSVICKYPLCLGNFTEAAATAGHEPWGKLPMVGAFSRISASRKGFWWNKNVHTSQRSVFFPENMGPSWCQWLSWCDGGHGGLPVAQGVLQRAWAWEKRAGGKTAGAALQGAAFNCTNKCRDVGSSLP